MSAGAAMEASLSRRLMLATAAAMLAAALASLAVTLLGFGAGLERQMLEKTAATAASVARDVEDALALGIPLDRLRGLDAFADAVAAATPEVASVRIAAGPAPAPQGPAAGIVATVLPGLPSAHPPRLVTGGVADGAAHVAAELDAAFVRTQLREAFFDTLMILIATTLVSFELIAVVTGNALIRPSRIAADALSRRGGGEFAQYRRPAGNPSMAAFVARLNAANAALRDRAARLGGPAARALAGRHALARADRARDAAVIDARIPLFLFCFAEELQKSFLPLFVAEYHRPGDLFGRDIMMGLPISVFMFVIAAITPFAGALVERHGNRRLFLAGLVPAVAGHAGCALASSGNDIVLARGVTALGYAVITISCQSYIAHVATKGSRAKSMAIFVGVLMTATLCGTAIGAILADWLGYRPVFAVSAVLAALAGVVAFVMLDPKVGGAPRRAASAPAATTRATSPTMALLSDRRFVTIVLLCAIPTKVVLTGFLYLFVPIYLASLEATQSEIGRIMMVYALVIIPISPIASGAADRLGQSLKVAVFATIASGIVLLGFLQSPGAAGVLAIVAGLGVAHAFVKAPLIVSIMEAAERVPDVPTTTALGLLRTCERIGSFVGPVAVAALMIRFGHAEVAVIVGLAVALSGALLLSLRERSAS